MSDVRIPLKSISEVVRRSRAVWIVWSIVVLFAALYVLAGIPVHNARAEWRTGQRYVAITTLERWSRFGLRPADYEEMLAVVLLSAGRSNDAAPLLERLSRRDPALFPPVSKKEVARALVTSGRYREFLAYDAAAHHRRESADVALYRAAALLGAGRIAQAENLFGSLHEGDFPAARYAALRQNIARWKEGSVPYVVDRTGKTIAVLQVSSGDLVAVNVDFAPLIDRSAGALTFEQRLSALGTANSVITTLDPDAQRAALAALGQYRGSIVAIDVRNGDILALASSPGAEPSRNLALEQQYEPGSVVKVVTAMNATRSGIDLGRIFPLQCEGYLIIDGRQFFDWAMHGTVPDLDDAMAISCNVAFGRIGLALGREKLVAFMRQAQFDGWADLGFARVPLGRIRAEPRTDFEAASLAIGLQQETINALHLAMIGAAVANRGIMSTPRLIAARRSILGDMLPVTTQLRRSVLGDAKSVAPVLEAMKASVTSPRGTGKRAAVQGLSIALKTGTAGNAQNGFNSLIVAVAPAENPRIALGMIAEDAGPAEFAGALIAQSFFQRMAGRMR